MSDNYRNLSIKAAQHADKLTQPIRETKDALGRPVIQLTQEEADAMRIDLVNMSHRFADLSDMAEQD